MPSWFFVAYFVNIEENVYIANKNLESIFFDIKFENVQNLWYKFKSLI